MGTLVYAYRVVPVVPDELAKGLGEAFAFRSDGSPDAFDHIIKHIVMRGPPADGFAMCRQHLELGEGGHRANRLGAAE